MVKVPVISCAISSELIPVIVYGTSVPLATFVVLSVITTFSPSSIAKKLVVREYVGAAEGLGVPLGDGLGVPLGVTLGLGVTEADGQGAGGVLLGEALGQGAGGVLLGEGLGVPLGVTLGLGHGVTKGRGGGVTHGEEMRVGEKD